MEPALTWPPELLLRAQGIRLALFDVDGVLTDGGLLYGGDGESLKRFHAHDGHGLKLLAAAGIVVAVVSGRDSAPLRTRLAELRIEHLHLGVADKLPVAEALLQRLELTWGATAVIGDDWPDLPLLRRARLACVPPGAHAQALAQAHCVTEHAGGCGAAREFCDLLLVAGGHYRRLLEQAVGGR